MATKQDLFAPPTKAELEEEILFTPPTEEELSSAPKHSIPETIALKGAQGALFNTVDELAGGLAGYSNVMVGKNAPENEDKALLDRLRARYLEGYRGKRDEIRAAEKQMQEQRPVLSTASEIGGGLLLPGGAASQVAKKAPLLTRLAKGAAAGAGYAGLAGAGASEGDTLQEVAADTAKASAAGAVIGSAIPLAGAGIKAAGSKVKDAASGYFTNVKNALDFLDEKIDLSTTKGRDKFLTETKGELEKVANSIQTKVKSLMDDRDSQITKADLEGVKLSIAPIEAVIKKAKEQLKRNILNPEEAREVEKFIANQEAFLYGPEVEAIKQVYKRGATFKSGKEIKDALIKNHEKKVLAGVEGQGQLPKSYSEVVDDVSGKKEIYAVHDSAQPGTQTGIKLLGKYKDVPKSYSEIIPEEVSTMTRPTTPLELTPSRAAEKKSTLEFDKAVKKDAVKKFESEVAEGLQDQLKTTGAAPAIKGLHESDVAFEHLGVPSLKKLAFTPAKDETARKSQVELVAADLFEKLRTKDENVVDITKQAIGYLKLQNPEAAEQLQKHMIRILNAGKLNQDITKTVAATPTGWLQLALSKVFQNPALGAKLIVNPIRKVANSKKIAVPVKTLNDVLNTNAMRGRALGGAIATEADEGDEEISEFKKSSTLVNTTPEKLTESLRNVDLTPSENKLIKKLLEMKPGQERAVALKNFSDQSQQNRELLRKLGLMGEVK